MEASAGWVQSVIFVVTGLLFVGGALGLWRTLRAAGGSFWGPLLIGLAGIGLV